MERLTQAEEEVMMVLWEHNECTVREVLNYLDDEDTPYTTLSSVIRLLESKGFVKHRAVGNTYLFGPLVQKEDYLQSSLKGLLNQYFEGSFTNLASFFATENNISMRDLREMMNDIKEDLREDKKNEGR